MNVLIERMSEEFIDRTEHRYDVQSDDYHTDVNDRTDGSMEGLMSTTHPPINDLPTSLRRRLTRKSDCGARCPGTTLDGLFSLVMLLIDI